jgi:molecular chaperone GrpE
MNDNIKKEDKKTDGEQQAEAFLKDEYYDLDEETTPDDGLANKLAEAEARASEMQDSFLRAKAETDNIRRRSQEDIVKARKYAVESFAEEMLAVKDSLEMALKTESPSLESFKEGIELTLTQFNDALKKNRVIEVSPAVKDLLDPTKHQAIATVESDQEVNTIVAVMQKGYMIADRLLRPAMVTVAKPKEKDEQEQTQAVSVD